MIHTVRRLALPLIALAFFNDDALAQVMLSPAFEAKTNSVQPEVTETVANRMDLYPAVEPDPAMKYRFWPAAEQRVEGNPMPFVNRAVLISSGQFMKKDAVQQYNMAIAKFQNMTLEEISVDELREFVNSFASAPLRELARAENLMRVEYDLRMNELNAAERVGSLLPEYQEMRVLGWMLHCRMRLSILESRWDDFAKDCRICFRLSEIAGHSNDFLVCRLIGYAIATQAFATIEEAMTRPDCPNFYWALASIPEQSLFEIRSSLEFESVLLSRFFGIEALASDHSIGAATARNRLKQMAEQASEVLLAKEAGPDDKNNAHLVAGLYVVMLAESSRELLAETDQWRDQVNSMSSAEAVLRAMQISSEQIRDRWTKWMLLGDENWDRYGSQAEQSLKPPSDYTNPVASMTSMLVPAADSARRAARRSIQQHHFLCTVEAIRMHAAESDELPTSIENLQPVPAWSDAMNRESFGYKRTSKTTAVITRSARWHGDQDHVIEIHLKTPRNQ